MYILPIEAIFATAVGSAFLSSNVAFTVPLQTMGFLAFASPYVASVEQVNIVIRGSLSFHFYKLHRLKTLVLMLAVIVTVVARAEARANSIIVETRAVEFETVRFRTVTRTIR